MKIGTQRIIINQHQFNVFFGSYRCRYIEEFGYVLKYLSCLLGLLSMYAYESK